MANTIPILTLAIKLKVAIGESVVMVEGSMLKNNIRKDAKGRRSKTADFGNKAIFAKQKSNAISITSSNGRILNPAKLKTEQRIVNV